MHRGIFRPSFRFALVNEESRGRGFSYKFSLPVSEPVLFDPGSYSYMGKLSYIMKGGADHELTHRLREFVTKTSASDGLRRFLETRG